MSGSGGPVTVRRCESVAVRMGSGGGEQEAGRGGGPRRGEGVAQAIPLLNHHGHLAQTDGRERRHAEEAGKHKR